MKYLLKELFIYLMFIILVLYVWLLWYVSNQALLPLQASIKFDLEFSAPLKQQMTECLCLAGRNKFS
jgi:hypothetical protein